MGKIEPTYENIGKHLLTLIKKIKYKSKMTPLVGKSGHLSAEAEELVSVHFPKDWLKKISVHVEKPVPVPSVPALIAGMGWADEIEFEAAIKGEHKGTKGEKFLLKGLKKFEKAPLIGITYDKVIVLFQPLAGSLDNLVHELTHTLQWEKYGDKFLQKYFRGYVEAETDYFKNPAEVNAVGAETRYRAWLNSGLNKSTGKKLSKPYLDYSLVAMNLILKKSEKEMCMEMKKAGKPLMVTGPVACAKMDTL